MKVIKSVLKKIYRVIVIGYFKILYGKIEFKNNYRSNSKKYLKKDSLKKCKKKILHIDYNEWKNMHRCC